jgi:hypothetical protein
MKTFLRVLLYLALTLWVGAEFFFPFVAATVFTTLRPDTHTAGLIVGHLLKLLHGLGIASGLIAILMLARMETLRHLSPRKSLLPIALLAGAVLLTVASQFGVTPAMERDRIATGGSVDAAMETNPARIEFKRLHSVSEGLEGLILFLGLATVTLLAKTEAERV